MKSREEVVDKEGENYFPRGLEYDFDTWPLGQSSGGPLWQGIIGGPLREPFEAWDRQHLADIELPPIDAASSFIHASHGTL